jgi:uncharacterized protein with LGFP repeats
MPTQTLSAATLAASPAALPTNRLTLGQLLDNGLPDAVVAAAAEENRPILAGAAVVDAIKLVASDLAIDARFAGVDRFADAFRAPLDAANFFIGLKYSELGGATGFLGSPETSVTPCPDGEGFFRHFRGGSIYWHPATGAHEVHGEIRNKWASLGWERGLLGYPTTDQMPGRDPRAAGVFNHFQRGSIWWHPNPLGGLASSGLTTVLEKQPVVSATVNPDVMAAVTGIANRGATLAAVAARPAAGVATTLSPAALGNVIAQPGSTVAGSAIRPPLAVEATAVTPDRIGPVISFGTAREVHGAIRAKYLALGAEASVLGYPTTDETGTPDGIGRFNHFEGGSIYWTANTGAWEVHGLIRGFWAANGWERNPNLGYPISDELIPDRRIGHRRPESRRRPILNVPSDVVKLPAEAAGLGFPNAMVNTPARGPVGASAAAVAALPAGATAVKPVAASGANAVAASPAASAVVSGGVVATIPTAEVTGVVRPGGVLGGVVGVDTNLGAVLDPGLLGPASTPASEASRNRFGDFENGVVFWRRGDTAAAPLGPWPTAADGSRTRLSADEVVALARPALERALANLGNATLAGIAFVGTTAYAFDGLAVRNRRHRLRLMFMAMRRASGLFGIGADQPTTAAAEVEIESTYEPMQRKVKALVAGWTPVSIPGDLTAQPPLDRQLHARLDPLLFTSFDLFDIPDTNAGKPIALLSVKTMPNGDVNVYIEPQE